jgi:WD40 repeat protein
MTRLALVSVDGTGPVQFVEDDGAEVTTLIWGEGPLLLGRSGEVWVIGDPSSPGGPGRHALPTWAAPRCVATNPAGLAAVGLADGSVFTWEPGSSGSSGPGAGHVRHDGPVRALAWAPDARALATGGADGRVRVWDGDDAPRHALDLGDAVVALAWLDDGLVIAKVGDGLGRLVALRPD